jgi:hypothetical protein
MEALTSKSYSLGQIAGLRLSATRSAAINLLVVWAILTGIGFGLLRLPPGQALLGGVLATALHYASELWHHCAHALAARHTGHPMIGIHFGSLLAASLYPRAEGQLPPQVHIRRALGGPIGSLALAVLAGLLALALRSSGGLAWWLAAFTALENLLVLTLGGLAAAELCGRRLDPALVAGQPSIRRYTMRHKPVWVMLAILLLAALACDSSNLPAPPDIDARPARPPTGLPLGARAPPNAPPTDQPAPALPTPTPARTRMPEETIETYARDVLGFEVDITFATSLAQDLNIPLSAEQGVDAALALSGVTYFGLWPDGLAAVAMGEGSITGDYLADIQNASLGAFSLRSSQSLPADAAAALALIQSTYPRWPTSPGAG